MYLIDGPGIVGAKPARTSLGMPGWFNQSPGTSPGTIVTGEFLNMLQAELLSVIEAADIDLDKSDDSQLLQALRKLIAGIVPTGIRTGFTGRTAPAGWILASGRTIGSATSGATERAHADTKPLFLKYWDDYDDAELPIQSSSGAPSARGVSAQSDWDAGKRMKVPDYNDRGGVGRGDMGGTPINRITVAKSGVDTTKMGAAGGIEAKSFAFSGATGSENGASVSAQNGGQSVAPAPHTHSYSGTTTEASIMNPFIVETIIIKL